MISNYLYILVAFLVIYAVRVLPLTLIRKPVRSRFIRSFLYYVPYVTLAVMTFPAIIDATQSQISGGLALVAGIAAAWFGASLFKVALLWHVMAGAALLVFLVIAAVVFVQTRRVACDNPVEYLKKE